VGAKAKFVERVFGSSLSEGVSAMLRNRSRKSGFTLVEILIVVIILGILAAIVIPQFTSASTDARKNSVRSQLQTLRSQVELYKLQHGDALPDLVTNWNPLLNTSTYSGTTFGPYLQQIPVNPMNGRNNVVNGNGTAAAGSAAGFVYDLGTGTPPNGTGRIWATDSNGTTLFVE
jgi:general secretion pathway protein G